MNNETKREIERLHRLISSPNSEFADLRHALKESAAGFAIIRNESIRSGQDHIANFAYENFMRLKALS